MANNELNGLSIREEEFLVMRQKEQNLVLFKNIKDIKKQIKGYQLYYKVTTIIGGVLVTGMGILFSFHLNN